MEELVKKVIEWGEEKGIFENSTPEKQFLKTMEEVGELASAINKNDLAEIKDAIGDIVVTLILQMAMHGLHVPSKKYPIRETDHFLDMVCLNREIWELGRYIANNEKSSIFVFRNSFLFISGISNSFNLSLEECLQSAYDVISKRNGKMVNGIFVKDE